MSSCTKLQLKVKLQYQLQEASLGYLMKPSDEYASGGSIVHMPNGLVNRLADHYIRWPQTRATVIHGVSSTPLLCPRTPPEMWDPEEPSAMI